MTRRTHRSLVTLTLFVALVTACRERPSEPESKPNQPSSAPVEAPVEAEGVTGPDPEAGDFTLAEAKAGLTGKGPLLAEIKTELGTMSCELLEEQAPISVANFVGLARGLRPFQVKGRWVKRPAYDGLTFHRIIKGFMIQGGDPEGNGSGEPGYVIKDEIWAGSRHDQRGLLCMANRGKNTNGMQFFITDAAAPHLDGGYTILGRCSPDEVIDKLASVPTRGDRPLKAPRIESVTITNGQ